MNTGQVKKPFDTTAQPKFPLMSPKREETLNRLASSYSKTSITLSTFNVQNASPMVALIRAEHTTMPQKSERLQEEANKIIDQLKSTLTGEYTSLAEPYVQNTQNQNHVRFIETLEAKKEEYLQKIESHRERIQTIFRTEFDRQFQSESKQSVFNWRAMLGLAPAAPATQHIQGSLEKK